MITFFVILANVQAPFSLLPLAVEGRREKGEGRKEPKLFLSR
jgi:hypothetical protein